MSKSRHLLTVAVLIVIVAIASAGHLVGSAATFDCPLPTPIPTVTPMPVRCYMPLMVAAGRVYLPAIWR